MRNCKRCKSKEAEKCSLNCKKCNERNDKYNAKLIAENTEKQLTEKPIADYVAYGGLGMEMDKPGFNYSVYQFN